MQFEKIHLDDIKRCYCASHMFIDDKPYIFFASEDPESPCYAYTGEEFKDKEVLWEEVRGGCMSIIPFQNRKGEFLAVNDFYLKVSPSFAKLIFGKKQEDGTWYFKDIFNLPYLHRFDIYHIDNKDYLICTSIARDKANKEDWTRPGQVYVGLIPEDLENNNIVLRQVADNLYHNHGYIRGNHNGHVCGYFASDEGVFRLDPPINQEDWTFTKIKDGKTSEMAFGDLDGDGVEEMITIEPFHGNGIKIYKLENNEYKEVYNYPHEMDFGHALVFDEIGGKKCFICGIRRVDAELAIITYENGEYHEQIIDQGGGPANLDVIHAYGNDYILAANHTKNEAAIYKYIGE